MPTLRGRVIEVCSAKSVLVETRRCCKRVETLVYLEYSLIATEEVTQLALRRLVFNQPVVVTYETENLDKSITGILWITSGTINVNTYLADTGLHRNSLSQIRSNFPLRQQ